MEELYSILAAVELPEDHPCIFRSNHVSNYVQLAGTLPKDKERLLGEIAWSASELGKIKDWDVYNNNEILSVPRKGIDGNEENDRIADLCADNLSAACRSFCQNL
mgnify:CR=1 FL=1